MARVNKPVDWGGGECVGVGDVRPQCFGTAGLIGRGEKELLGA